MSDLDLKSRLYNWGCYCRLGFGGPDSSCANPMYEQMIPPGPEEYGEVTADTVIVEQAHDARPEQEIDEPDAESLDFMIRQLSQGHRATLATRYVLLVPPNTPEAKSRVVAARMALAGLIDANRATVGVFRLMGY